VSKIKILKIIFKKLIFVSKLKSETQNFTLVIFMRYASDKQTNQLFI
jgi:hypothetical protein